MRDSGLTSLHDARSHGGAVAAFTVYTLESVVAVTRAATRRGRATMLQAATGSFDDVGRDLLGRVMLMAADQATVPVGVHLDHSRDLDEVRDCLELGFTSVMFDGSALPFEENVARTAAAVELAHARGAWIEGELGALGGAEDASQRVSTAGEQPGMTDPEAARAYVEATGLDALAVAVGNVHGMYAAPPQLDLDRLARLRAAVQVPLVLHGASGLPAEQLRRAVAIGVAKINVNTELRRAYLSAFVPDGDGDDVRPVRRRAIDAMAEVAGQQMDTVRGMELS